MLSASRAPLAGLRSLLQPRAHTALTLALFVVGCTVYDSTLLGERRGDGQGATGGSARDSEHEGGSAASAGVATGTGAEGALGGSPSSSSGGARSGNGGSATRGSSGDAEGGVGGQVVGSSQGGSDTSGASGSKGLGGSMSSGGASGGAASTAGASSGGNEAAGAGGSADGGSEAGGSGKGGSTSGGTGSAGSSGTGGAAGRGGSGGATSGGTTGTGGASETCSGCARLSVPLTMTTDQARFALTLPSATDLSDTTITLRVARQKGTGGTILVYLQAGGPNYTLLFSAAIKINSLSSSMQNIVWNVGDATGSAGAAAERIGLEIVGTGGSSFSNPTVIYIDRVDVARSSLAMGSWTFDTAASINTTPTTSGAAGRMWLNSYSADTNVSGATISWLGP